MDAFSTYGDATRGFMSRPQPASIDFDAIRSSYPLSSVVAPVVKLLRAGGEWKACCPFHQDRTPSFTVNDAKGFYHCFGCGAHGDVLDFLVAYHGVSITEAIERLGAGELLASDHRRARPYLGDREQVEASARTDEANAIWSQAVPIAGTIAERYLRGRAITVPLPDVLRFARIRLGRRPIMPAMVALVTDVSNVPIGIQRTFLTEEGAKADLPDGKVKFSLGRVKGGAIRIGPVEREMTICAGVEDGLSLAELGAASVFAAPGDEMLAGMVLPNEVLSVIVGGDADPSGQKASRSAAENQAAHGRASRIIMPNAPHKDFNAELQEASRGH